MPLSSFFTTFFSLFQWNALWCVQLNQTRNRILEYFALFERFCHCVCSKNICFQIAPCVHKVPFYLSQYRWRDPCMAALGGFYFHIKLIDMFVSSHQLLSYLICTGHFPRENTGRRKAGKRTKMIFCRHTNHLCVKNFQGGQ